RRGADNDMGEKRSVNEIHLVLANEFFDHFRAARSVGAVILDDDLDRPAIDAAGFVDQLYGGGSGAIVPAAIGRADAGAVALEADADRFGRLRLRVAGEPRSGEQRSPCAEALQCRAAGQAVASSSITVADLRHGLPYSLNFPRSGIRPAETARNKSSNALSGNVKLLSDQPIDGVESNHRPKTV